jgi:hypothetical protein
MSVRGALTSEGRACRGALTEVPIAAGARRSEVAHVEAVVDGFGSWMARISGL